MGIRWLLGGSRWSYRVVLRQFKVDVRWLKVDMRWLLGGSRWSYRVVGECYLKRTHCSPTAGLSPITAMPASSHISRNSVAYG